MIKSLKKIISLLLIIGLYWTGLLAIGQTRAYFNDLETSENKMTIGTLDMTIRSGQGNFISPAENMNPGDSTARDIYVGKTALSLPLKHQVSFEFMNGDLDFCDQLDLKIWYDHYHGPVSGGYANRDMRLTYNGKLSALNNYFNADFIIPHPDDWFDLDPSDGTEQWFYYSISLPNDVGNSYQGKTCNFDFVYEGRQEDCDCGCGGFFDIERISNVITAGSQVVDSCMKINEVYYDPDAEHQGKPNEEKFEWIELYNACDYEVNLKNWYIEDNNDKEIIHSSYPVDPGQFVVVAASAAVWNKYWTLIPVNAVKIALGGLMMSDGLDNNGDRVVLYDNNGNQIDEVSWGTDTFAFVPSVPVVPEGCSIARNPKGYDTDKATDWINTCTLTPPGPNPGTNPHSKDGELLLLPPATNSLPEPIPEPMDNNGMPDIVINEFLASGEYFDDFIELYNNSDFDILVNGWLIEVENNDTTYESDLEGEIKSKDWLLVECLDENILQADGVITLYDNNGNEIDKIFYTNADIADKSFARIPDGTLNWVDPVPTPGKTNVTPENLALADLNADDLDLIESDDDMKDEFVADEDENEESENDEGADDVEIKNEDDDTDVEEEEDKNDENNI